MKDLICDAIRERRILEVFYHGYTRIIAPHIYGVDTTGEELLSCYQVAGGSQGGESTGWKSLKASELLKVHLTRMHFQPRPEYREDDKAMSEVYCRVER